MSMNVLNNHPTRLFAIGDIHGCREQLETLLKIIVPNKDDTIVFLGDMIDRGSDSKGVIDIIRHYQTVCQVIVIMGNHEEMMLGSLRHKDYLRSWLKFGGEQALYSFGLTADFHGLMAVPYEYIAWLKQAVNYYETDDFIFCHATPLPNLPLDKQIDQLRWRKLDEPIRHQSGKMIICGHTEQKDGQVLCADGIICIDTFAYGGGRLTALEVYSGTIYQIDNQLQLYQKTIDIPPINT